MDVFNPKNEECRLGCHDESKVYLCLVVSQDEFEPCLNVGPSTRDRESLYKKHACLNEMIKAIYEMSKPSFVFGTTDQHLLLFCHAHHFHKKLKPIKLSFEDILWPWAIYPPGSGIALPEGNVIVPPSEEHAGLFVDHLPDRAALVWSVENRPDDDELYAEKLGLKTIYSIPRKRAPLPKSWVD